jgi:hypothetical protein
MRLFTFVRVKVSVGFCADRKRTEGGSGDRERIDGGSEDKEQMEVVSDCLDDGAMQPTRRDTRSCSFLGEVMGDNKFLAGGLFCKCSVRVHIKGLDPGEASTSKSDELRS